jgi:hypothetical protein
LLRRVAYDLRNTPDAAYPAFSANHSGLIAIAVIRTIAKSFGGELATASKKQARSGHHHGYHSLSHWSLPSVRKESREDHAENPEVARDRDARTPDSCHRGVSPRTDFEGLEDLVGGGVIVASDSDRRPR